MIDPGVRNAIYQLHVAQQFPAEQKTAEKGGNEEWFS